MPDSSGLDDFYLSDVSPKDKPWDTHRANATVVQKLYEGSDHQSYAERIQQCSKVLGFALEAQDSGEFKLQLQQAKFCRVRHCPVCQWRRSLMWRARFFTALPKVIEAYPTARWVFLTLTVKNCPVDDLRGTLKRMNRAWERLTQRKQFPALGYVKSLEVSCSASGEAHPHFHILLMVSPSYFGKPYLTQAEWTELWKQALRADYTPVVNVKAVKPRKGQEESSGVVTALLETLKYGVKEADLVRDAAWLRQITTQLHKTRAVSVGGVLRQFLSEEDPEDLIHTEEESGLEDDQDSVGDDVNIYFGWRELAKKYVKTEP